MWTVHCFNNMVVFCNFSFSNHHEKWPSSKTTIINSNPSYLNCTLCKRMLGSKTSYAKCEFSSRLYNIYCQALELKLKSKDYSTTVPPPLLTNVSNFAVFNSCDWGCLFSTWIHLEKSWVWFYSMAN